MRPEQVKRACVLGLLYYGNMRLYNIRYGLVARGAKVAVAEAEVASPLHDAVQVQRGGGGWVRVELRPTLARRWIQSRISTWPASVGGVLKPTWIIVGAPAAFETAVAARQGCVAYLAQVACFHVGVDQGGFLLVSGAMMRSPASFKIRWS